MIELNLTTAVLIFSGIIVHGCNDTNRLSKLELRARNVFVDGSRITLHDFYISETWYNLRQEGQQYLMPDSRTLPELQACGSYQPIYMNGTHPDFEDLPADSTPLDFVACTRTQFDVCEYTFNIKVRRCGPDIHYFLQYTSQRSAYCFDPPYLQTIPGTFRALKDVNVGTIAVVPSLSFEETVSGGITTYTPISIFKCDFVMDKFFYKVNWTIHGEQIHSLEQNTSVGTHFEVSESHLFEMNISMPFNILCGVHVAGNPYGEMTYLNSSDTYFVGLKVHNNLVNISKGGYANIVFQLTAPIGCLYTDSVNINNSCVVSLEMVSLSSPSKCDSGNIAVVTKTDHCGPAINTTTKANLHTWTSDTIYTVQLTNADVNTGDRREYKVALKFPGNYQHRIWANYRSSFIDIHIGDDKPRGFCYSRVNSQVRTADGYCMNANVVGDLILYWNKKYDIMVQQRTTYCRNNQTTCVCALAIRAGSNVFVIDLCKSFSYIDYLMCEDVQTLKVELIEGTQNVYKIITPSGAKVVADILQLPLYRGYMNIDIYLSAKDFEEGQGLCGTYNGDMTDDLIHQDGLSSDLQQTVDCFLRRHDSFINSWRVDDSNTLLSSLGRNMSARRNSEQHTFCICGQSPNNTNVSGDTDQLPVCSAFDTIFCKHEEDTKHSSCVSYNGTTSRRNEIERLESNKNRAQSPVFNMTNQSTVTQYDAESFCQTLVNRSFGAVEKLLKNAMENKDSIKAHCAHLVKLYNSYTAVAPMIAAIFANIQYLLDNDEVFVVNNGDLVETFAQTRCVYNCDRETGACDSSGKCTCELHFHGADCNIDDRIAPVITDLEGNGFYSPSRTNMSCFFVYFHHLLRTFSYNIDIDLVFINGSTTSVGETSVNGVYEDMFTGKCCVPDKASIPGAFVYRYNISVTYDGISFSDIRSMYVYQALCQEHFQSQSGLQFKLKDDFCFIDGQCVVNNDADDDDPCMRCMPDINKYSWSHGCESHTTGESKTAILIGGATVGSTTAVVVLVIIIACCCRRKRRKSKEEALGSDEYTLNSREASPEESASDEYTNNGGPYTSLDRTYMVDTYDTIGSLDNSNLQLPIPNRRSTTQYEILNNNANSNTYDRIQLEPPPGGAGDLIAMVHDRSTTIP